MNVSDFAKQIRVHSLKMVHHANASHIGGVFSMADILAVLYMHVLNLNPDKPDWEDRDRFLLSKGHSCAGLYACLALKGFFPLSELDEYGQNGSRLITHVSNKLPGVELSTGSLGLALSVASGLAIAAKRKNKNWHVFALLSDGELDEGSNWEPILLAPQLKLDNLIVIVDYNKIQSLGRVSEVIALESVKDKFEAFNWEVAEVDGHDCEALLAAFAKMRTPNGKPKAIIAHTVKGKGVSFMEDRLLWHYKSPNLEQYNQAIDELNNQ
ncbi:MAG: transketolase [Mangrovibacterium sp.]